MDSKISPRDGHKIVRDGLARISRPTVEDNSSDSDAYFTDIDALAMSSAYATYTASISSIMGQFDPADLRFNAWRYFVFDQNTNVVAFCDVFEDVDSHFELGLTNFGPLAHVLASEIAQYEQLSTAIEPSLQIIEIPAIYVVALWVSNKLQQNMMPIQLPAVKNAKYSWVSATDFFETQRLAFYANGNDA